MLLGLGLYVAALLWSYMANISPNFAYLSYTYRSPNLLTLTIGIGLLFFVAVRMPLSLTRPSQLIYWLLYVFVLVPSILIPQFTSSLSDVELLLLEFCLAGSFLTLSLVYRVPLLRLRPPSLPPGVFWGLLAFISAFAYAALFRERGFHFTLPSLSGTALYELRESYSASIGRYPSYLVELQSNVVNPFLIAFGILRRKRLALAAGVLGQVAIFSATGFKLVLTSTLLLPGVALLMRGQGTARFGSRLTLSLPVVIVSAAFLDHVTKTIAFTSLFVRRVMVTPGLLTGFYYDFFSRHPQLDLGHSILSPFVNYPYTTSPALIIGAQYFSDSKASANGNIFADGFANFGFVGCFLVVFVLAAVFLILDSIAVNRDLRLATLLVSIPAITLSNSGLLTTLLTHGATVAVLLIAVMPFPRDQVPNG